MISFKFSRPKFVYGIERGEVARRLVMVYVPVSCVYDSVPIKAYVRGMGRGSQQPDTGRGAESVARPPGDERQRVFEADTLFSEPARTVDQGRR
jgi:hypothetical protein